MQCGSPAFDALLLVQTDILSYAIMIKENILLLLLSSVSLVVISRETLISLFSYQVRVLALGTC